MLSSDRNIEQLAQLAGELKKYARLQGERVRLDMVNKLSALVGLLAVVIVSLFCATAVLLFLSYALVLRLADSMSMPSACLIVAAGYAVLAALVYYKRKVLIIYPLTNVLGHLFLDESNPSDSAK